MLTCFHRLTASTEKVDAGVQDTRWQVAAQALQEWCDQQHSKQQS